MKSEFNVVETNEKKTKNMWVMIKNKWLYNHGLTIL